jgi:hypothetical protein
MGPSKGRRIDRYTLCAGEQRAEVLAAAPECANARVETPVGAFVYSVDHFA